MAFDLSTAKPVEQPQVSGGFDLSTAQPVQAHPEQPQTLLERFKANQEKRRSWGDVAIEGAGNLVPSVGNLIGGIYQTVRHPVDTATNLGKLVVGAGESGVEKLVGLVAPELVAFNKQINVPSEEQSIAQNVADYYGKKYGSVEGFKEALATDPAGVMADAATVLTAGGAAASKAPMLQKAGQVLSKAGQTIDPLALTVKAAGGAAKLVGKGAQAGLGMTTGAGAESIKQAYEAGKSGGKTAESFKSNLRGSVPMTDVLDTAKSDLAAMNAAKTAEYRANMSAVKEIAEPLPFDDIGKAIKNAYDKVTFKGQIKNAKGAEVVKKISDAVGDWKELNPSEFHTPEGIDALKQVIGGIVESIPMEEKTARAAGDAVYHAVKKVIVDKAPTYAKTMKDYSEATDQIREIERALSLGKTASADTAMRKLQSLMRNNVSTNYGNRLKLAQELESKGGGEIMPSLAGQALSGLEPRGLQRLGAAGVGAAGLMTANPMAIPLLTASSPRLMGEAAYYAGKTAGAGGNTIKAVNKLAELINVNPTIAANLAYQAQQSK